MKGSSVEGVKLSQLKIFIAVAEHQNFSEAALHLQISQSAVSHAIATLEDELGVVLLSRGRHGAQLTPVGERVLHYARQMMLSLQEIGREANLARGLEGGKVRVASFRSVATHLLPLAIAQFRKRFPGVAAVITEHQDYIAVEQALREGRADIGITYLPSSAEFETWELLRDEYLVLLPPDANICRPLRWEDLQTYPLISAPESDACCILVQKHLAQQGLNVQAAYEISEDSTIISMVAQGLGYAILPRLAAKPLPPEIQVASLPTPLERIIGVGILAEALHSPAVFAFLDTLKAMPQRAGMGSAIATAL
ncbi:MAG: LysR family transcriptional regulator [Synechococcales bacterium]|nr:LysR family transcriptional regulator [Synechococcales bacterium]